MTKVLSFILVLMCVAACQKSVSNYDAFLQSWVGKSEAQLVSTWGAPIQMRTIAPNRQIFVYLSERQEDAAGLTPVNSILGDNSVYSQNTDALGQVYTYYCQTTFTTQDDIIVDYAWSGDACQMD